MNIAALENEMAQITKDFREKMAAFDVTNMELRNLEAKIEAVKAAEKAKPSRNWPERIEAGMVFRHKRQGDYLATFAGYLVCIADGGYWSQDRGFDGDEDQFTYLGHARDILTRRTDAHEPTGTELVVGRGWLNNVRLAK